MLWRWVLFVNKRRKNVNNDDEQRRRSSLLNEHLVHAVEYTVN